MTQVSREEFSPLLEPSGRVRRQRAEAKGEVRGFETPQTVTPSGKLTLYGL